MIFLHIEDHINQRTYPLSDIPVTYGPMNPYFFDKNTCGPIHQPYDGETGRGRYCIIHMIDMYFNKIPFTIVENGDILDIEKNLKDYLLAIREVHSSTTDKSTIELIRRTTAFYDQIYRAARKLRHRYPDKDFKPSPFVALVKEAEG